MGKALINRLEPAARYDAEKERLADPFDIPLVTHILVVVLHSLKKFLPEISDVFLEAFDIADQPASRN
jgi:hypothetical protein